jgi:ribonuclease Z
MANSLRARLALAVVARRLPALVAGDPVAKLGDGLYVAVVGSGSPLTDARRGNPCAAVIAGGRIFVVDAGERSAETMGRMQLASNRIAAVLLTHFHSDHIGGLGTVNLQRWVADAADVPLRVLGPPGVERVVAGFNEAYALDNGYRIAHHGPEVVRPSGAGMVAEPFSFGEGEDSKVVLDEDGLKVTAFLVDHTPVAPAVGYRFDYRGRSENPG